MNIFTAFNLDDLLINLVLILQLGKLFQPISDYFKPLLQ